MEIKGKDLEFISFIKRDGSGVIHVGTEWNSESGHPKTDDVSYMADEIFHLRCLSITHGTYIASQFNSWVVKLKK